MRNRRNLFIIFSLFLIIFSMSIVSASDNITSVTNENSILSVTDDVEDVGDFSVEESSDMKLESIDDQSKENSSEKNNDDSQILGATNDEPVLGVDRSLNGGTVDDIKREILYISQNGGGTLYLNGGTYTGSSKILAGSYDESNGDRSWDGDGTNSRPN